MQSAEAIVLNTLTRAQRFMDSNAPALGTIKASASRRIGSGETVRQRVLRNALRVKFMRPIVDRIGHG